MEFTLPPQACVERFIPKSKFFEKTLVNTKLKKEFTDKIQKIIWKYKLAEETIGINKTEATEEIQIFEIQLKEQIIPKNVLKVIDKTIPYPILYIFLHDTHVAYGITIKGTGEQRYYFSAWDEEKTFDFTGINLEKVYQKIITTFIDRIDAGTNDFQTVVDTDKRIQILEKEVEALKKKVRTEKQFNKQVALNRKLQTKKQELLELTSSSI